MATVTNTSTNAVNKNIIVPEVYAGLVDQKIAGKVVIAQAADRIGTLMGQVGETINFPSWVYTGDAKDISVGSAIPTTAMKQDNRQATIKMVAQDGIAVNDYDDAEEQVKECRCYTVEDLFCCGYARYFWEAIKIRYPEYCSYVDWEDMYAEN